MTKIGETEDGRVVVDGVFQLLSTHGLPLEMVFQFCQDNNLQPCWITFYRDAVENGWKHKTILARLEPAIIDSWGKIYWDIIIESFYKASALLNAIT